MVHQTLPLMQGIGTGGARLTRHRIKQAPTLKPGIPMRMHLRGAAGVTENKNVGRGLTPF